MIGVLIAVSLWGLAALLYWLLVTTEGTYLGGRVVTWLYDLVAHRYNKIKDLYYVDEARYLGLPLVEALSSVQAPRVLDVATGTGRVPLAILRAQELDGPIVALDRSPRMLAEARTVLEHRDGAVAFVLGDAGKLSFGKDTFDCVTCLEALEFMRDGAETLREMVRVLRSGGILLLSNRVGRDARFFPGRLCGRGRLERRLGELGLEDIKTQRWQVHYDLVWSRKRARVLKRPAKQAEALPGLGQRPARGLHWP